MEVEKAIKTAIEYENKVKDIYAEAAKNSQNEIARNVFRKLAREEQEHIDYLESRFIEWQKTGKVSLEKLKTIIPSKNVINEGVKKLKNNMKKSDKYGEVQMLGKALNVEIETSNFYKEMVDQLENEPQKMFKRFLEIEEGHLAIVQAEIDSITGAGFWFDFQEFNLEAEG
ncbi:MAG: ferritin family protein [candidate division Zixibacteria bacterium]|nr:ferritin family protein [candidate division Zixibacteria bacterium]